MQVQELIKELEKIKNKNKKVFIEKMMDTPGFVSSSVEIEEFLLPLFPKDEECVVLLVKREEVYLTKENIEQEGFVFLGSITNNDKKLYDDPDNIISICLQFQKGLFYLEYETISNLLKIYKFGYDIPKREYNKLDISHNWCAEYQPFFDENIIFKNVCKNIIQFYFVCKLLKI
jgi:hypothetical protein